MVSPASWRALAVLGAAGLAPTVLGACSSTSVLSLSVGDCMQSEDLGTGQVSDIATVACDEPHDAEVFAALELPEGDYPGIDAVRTAAEDFCLPEFNAWAGVAYLESDLDVYPLFPTEDSWTGSDDREILCIAVAPERVTGTLADSGR